MEIVNGQRDPFLAGGDLACEMLRSTIFYPPCLRQIQEEIELAGLNLLPDGEASSKERIISHAAEYLALRPSAFIEKEIRLVSQQFQNAEIHLHAKVAGPADGPVVLLLHGFPEFWYSWRAQIAPLAAAGFRVIVPDQRGYNLSSKPGGVKSYAMSELVGDVIAIADQLGRKQIFLAGHDWGAAVAWSVAMLHPQRVAKLAVLNVPHPLVMARHLKTNWRQMRKSWYMFFFQPPWLPEKVFTDSNFQMGERALLGSSRKETFSAGDLAKYRAAWSQPGAPTGMINWYRAAFRHRTRFPDTRVHVPTRILWGERDIFLSAEMAQDSLQYCDDASLFTFAEASHWLQHEEPEAVSRHLIEFFGAPAA